MQNERALVVASGGGIGDLFLVTPVLRALRSRFSHITVLINPKYAEVLAPHMVD
jgi:ADP-heptose:LPS heptosyltransferase